LKPDGELFDLFAALAAQTEQEGEVLVRVYEGRAVAVDTKPLILRLIIRRKDPEQALAEQKRLLKDAKKRGKQPDPRSLEAAKYILLLTSLPVEMFSAAEVLALYRFRWQIELAIKRMKSLAGLARLPAKKPELAQAWIYARLIVAILAEQIAGQTPESPPCGVGKWKRQPLALASHETGPRQHSCRGSWAVAVESHSRIVPATASPLV